MRAGKCIAFDFPDTPRFVGLTAFGKFLLGSNNLLSEVLTAFVRACPARPRHSKIEENRKHFSIMLVIEKPRHGRPHMLANLGNHGKVILVSTGAAALALTLLISGHFSAYRGGVDISDRVLLPTYFFLLFVAVIVIVGLLIALVVLHRKSNARIETLRSRIVELSERNSQIATSCEPPYSLTAWSTDAASTSSKRTIEAMMFSSGARTTDADGTALRPASHPPGGLIVLVAGANPLTALVVSALLTGLGHRPILTNDEAGVFDSWLAARTAGMPFDVILLNIRADDDSAYDAVRRIRIHEADGAIPRTPIIALTANDFPGPRDEILAAGLDDVLVTPLDRNRLCAALDVILPGQRAA